MLLDQCIKPDMDTDILGWQYDRQIGNQDIEIMSIAQLFWRGGNADRFF